MKPFQKRQTALALAAGFILAVLAVPGFVAAQQWVEPDGPPTAGTLPAFLNATSGRQKKLGSLLIGDASLSSPAKLCLNASSSEGANDAAACVTSWTTVLGTGGPYVTKFTGTEDLGQSSAWDQGFVVFRGDTQKFQTMTLIAEADPARPGTGGIYAAAPSDFQSAAEFRGTTVVGQTANQSEICLNDDGSSTACIRRWEDGLTITTPIIRLQRSRYFTADSGHLAITGTGVFHNSADTADGAIVIGDPSADVPTAVSCGDGLCTLTNGEKPENCSLDCGSP